MGNTPFKPALKKNYATLICKVGMFVLPVKKNCALRYKLSKMNISTTKTSETLFFGRGFNLEFVPCPICIYMYIENMLRTKVQLNFQCR